MLISFKNTLIETLRIYFDTKLIITGRKAQLCIGVELTGQGSHCILRLNFGGVCWKVVGMLRSGTPHVGRMGALLLHMLEPVLDQEACENIHCL